MQNLHVGRGNTTGALTVFPIWGESDVERDYSTAVAAAQVEERTSPEVNALMVTNIADLPLLLLEGQVLEGGWQNRMVARSLIVAPHAQLPVDVMCVEHGRWGAGRGRHQDTGRRVSARIRAGLYTDTRPQEAVWTRVAEYNRRYGLSESASFTEPADRAAHDTTALVRELHPFPGQLGIVLAIGGHPVSAEVFDSPATLAEQFRSIVTAAAMDALGREAEVTPSRRARRFIDDAANTVTHRSAPAGMGVTRHGRSDHVEIAELTWSGRSVHLSLLNRRHELAAMP